MKEDKPRLVVKKFMKRLSKRNKLDTVWQRIRGRKIKRAGFATLLHLHRGVVLIMQLN
jgi:hypothetical protein